MQEWDARTRSVLYSHNMPVGRHPKKEIAEVLRNVPDHLTVVQTAAGHRWGHVQCTYCATVISIWSTPRNPGNHAKDLARFLARHSDCPARAKQEET